MNKNTAIGIDIGGTKTAICLSTTEGKVLEKKIIPTIRDEGITVVLVEQNANMALKVADFGYIMENGRFVTSGSSKDLREDEDVKEFYLGIKLEESVKGEQRYKRKRRWG